MNSEVSRVDRWLAFDPGELTVIQAALALVADDVQTQAAKGQLDAAAAIGAANTFRVAEGLVFQIDDLRGEEHPPLEVIDAVAGMIASGEYAQIIAAADAPAEDIIPPIAEAA